MGPLGDTGPSRGLVLDPRVRLLGVDENTVADIAHLLGFLRDLRHRFASRALALGHSLTIIGKLLGHWQIQTTARYAHLARHSVKTAAEKIADSLLADITAAPDDPRAT